MHWEILSSLRQFLGLQCLRAARHAYMRDLSRHAYDHQPDTYKSVVRVLPCMRLEVDGGSRRWPSRLLTMSPPMGGQLDAFARGVIIGMAAAGPRSAKIAATVTKANGKHPTTRAVNQIAAKARTC